MKRFGGKTIQNVMETHHGKDKEDNGPKHFGRFESSNCNQEAPCLAHPVCRWSCRWCKLRGRQKRRRGYHLKSTQKATRFAAQLRADAKGQEIHSSLSILFCMLHWQVRWRHLKLSGASGLHKNITLCTMKFKETSVRSPMKGEIALTTQWL